MDIVVGKIRSAKEEGAQKNLFTKKVKSLVLRRDVKINGIDEKVLEKE